MEGIEKIVTGPRQNYYASLFLLEQFRRDGNKSYLESARRCCQWSVERHRRDGYLSEWLTLSEAGEWVPDRHPDVASPGAMTRVWLALDEAEPEAAWLEACREAAAWTLRWQRNQPEQPDLDGAVIVEPQLVAYHISFAAWGMLDLASRLGRGA